MHTMCTTPVSLVELQRVSQHFTTFHNFTKALPESSGSGYSKMVLSSRQMAVSLRLALPPVPAPCRVHGLNHGCLMAACSTLQHVISTSSNLKPLKIWSKRPKQGTQTFDCTTSCEVQECHDTCARTLKLVKT